MDRGTKIKVQRDRGTDKTIQIHRGTYRQNNRYNCSETQRNRRNCSDTGQTEVLKQTKLLTTDSVTTDILILFNQCHVFFLLKTLKMKYFSIFKEFPKNLVFLRKCEKINLLQTIATISCITYRSKIEL
jgi:hypothetical protein